MTDEASSTEDEALITSTELREVAEAAAADERSVLRRVVRLPVRGRRGTIIDRELAARGLPRTRA